MKRLTEEIARFFRKQGFVLVATIDASGYPHTSCKGILRISRDGRIYLIDAYMRRTFTHLKRNSRMSITAVEEHDFSGYCLKGKARIIPIRSLSRRLHAIWERKITERITTRIIRNLHEGKGHPAHPESQLPRPEYVFVMDVEEIVDLAPATSKKEA
jgi:uncharacterized pyridoxamine 5'-phosphate oxidase family protein